MLNLWEMFSIWHPFLMLQRRCVLCWLIRRLRHLSITRLYEFKDISEVFVFPMNRIGRKGWFEMKEKKRMAGLFLLLAVFCTACGSLDRIQNSQTQQDREQSAKAETSEREKNLDEILADLNDNSAKFLDFFETGYRVIGLELIKRNTKDDTDTVYCTVSLVKDTAMLVQDFKFSYNHYTTGGWILDAFESTGEADVTYTGEETRIATKGQSDPVENSSDTFSSVESIRPKTSPTGPVPKSRTFCNNPDSATRAGVILYPDPEEATVGDITIILPVPREEGKIASQKEIYGDYIYNYGGFFEAYGGNLEESGVSVRFTLNIMESPPTLFLMMDSPGEKPVEVDMYQTQAEF